MKALLIGNLTIDHNLTESGIYEGIGGSVYYCATLLHNLGVRSSIISPYGRDFPTGLPRGIELYPKTPIVPKTLLFRNKFIANGLREQRAENTESININQLGFIPDGLFRGNDIVFVAPLTDRFDMNQLQKWNFKLAQTFSILLPQGLYRRIKGNGEIVSKLWKYSTEVISRFCVIVVSEKDFSDTGKAAASWSSLGPIVIVTRERKGCSVYHHGLKTDYRGFEAGKIADSTGAGDTFAAAFGYAYLKTRNIGLSAEFSNAAAALSLRFRSDQLKYKKEDIVKFALLQGRRIII